MCSSGEQTGKQGGKVLKKTYFVLFLFLLFWRYINKIELNIILFFKQLQTSVASIHRMLSVVCVDIWECMCVPECTSCVSPAGVIKGEGGVDTTLGDVLSSM